MRKGNAERRRRGSITVLLSLLMLTILSLLGAALSSARIAAGRVALSCALEEGLYSGFSQYDRKLYDQFGLFFIDGGAGRESFQPGFYLDEIKDYADYIVHPAKSSGGLSGRDVLKFGRLHASIDGYILATDEKGSPYVRQVCRLMEKRTGTEALKGMQKKLEGSFSGEGCAMLQPRARMYFTDVKKAISISEETKTEITVPEDFQNPLPVLEQLKTMGILSLVLPTNRPLSEAAMGEVSWLDQRDLQGGMNLFPKAYRHPLKKIMLIQYASDFFSCFTQEKAPEGIQYRREALIAGKDSDSENLEAVVKKIMHMREVVNFGYLLHSPVRCAEADEVALFIATLLLQPETAPAISATLKALWAYAESLLDVRQLLKGGKVPFLKDDKNWQLSVTGLVDIMEKLNDDQVMEGEGLDYTDYLKFLMLKEKEVTLVMRMMTMTEYAIRKSGEESFRMNNCIDALSVEISGKTGGKELSIERSYCYE